ncbi:hypothetical protein GH714_002469 [Hevea brasiliensis]|uniref:Uncharacterized protein n=1 Tax=Hevea brasiliensis TaxID=3981 RepID=A0A6A6LBP9_HEVBR|nr:hypothetical protein GH714_002469 [Hevea brasiliensis]
MNKMPPFEEIASASLNDLSISDSENSVTSSGHEAETMRNSSPAYSALLPSAPFLPDDASSHQPLDYGLGIPGLMDGYPPVRRMTSSEWLRQYRENHNLERTTNHARPVHSYVAVNTGNFYGHDTSRSGLFDQFGAPLAAINPLIYEERPPLHSGFPSVYGTVDYRREKLYPGYQRPRPYGCGAVNEPEPLLQYLKEKEWLLQQDPTLRGPTYMGS